uniref:Pheromone binding protein 16 n=1 Tax=Cyrtotrachelus buqueti TaxID=1892066 RepID=A0A1L3KPQ9_9CUCU|nr:pheromone binding protein 16 [Cyrtotrachelus buqueti]
MKFVVLFCVVLLLATVVSSKKHHKNNNEVTPKKAFKECQKNATTRIDKQAVKKYKKKEVDSMPQNYGEHLLCIYKATGYIGEDGVVNQDVLKKKITKKAQPSQNVDTLLQECGAAKADPKQTAINLDSCLTKNNL